MSEEPIKIRITADDLESVRVEAPPWPAMPPARTGGAPPLPTEWGNVGGAAAGPVGTAFPGSAGGSFFLKSWVYLGIAGFVSAFLAWAVCEPGFDKDERVDSWGSMLIFPLVIIAISTAFAAAESLVERSVQKALTRGAIALGLGLVLGFVFSFLANVIYGLGLRFLAGAGGQIVTANPGVWFVRAIAWMVFGVTGGIVYGIAGQSGKKCLYGMLGGVLGAGVGGLLFDPISILTGGAAPSRCIGMMILGASTGVAIGLVESAMKDRWLYVSGGPLAGKQFILYKPVTRLGSEQASDIYLFKDPSIAPTHATIELRGPQASLTAMGAVFVGGQPVTQRVLRSGDQIQIRRYAFQYQEKNAQK